MSPKTLAVWAAAGLFGGCAARTASDPPSRSSGYSAWPSRGSDWANLSLNTVVEKYGPPDRIESDRVVWEHKGPWKRIVVFDKLDRYLSGTLADNIEGTLAYEVPDDRRRALADFGRQVKVSGDGTELSASASSESLAFLALNLADEVVHGVRTPEDANAFYVATIRLSAAGKASSYLQGLRFRPWPAPDAP